MNLGPAATRIQWRSRARRRAARQRKPGLAGEQQPHRRRLSIPVSPYLRTPWLTSTSRSRDQRLEEETRLFSLCTNVSSPQQQKPLSHGVYPTRLVPLLPLQLSPLLPQQQSLSIHENPLENSVMNITRAQLLTPVLPCPASMELLKKWKCSCTGVTGVTNPPRTWWLTTT